MSNTPGPRSEPVVVPGGAVVDRLLRFIELDDAFADLLGASPAELLGQQLGDHLAHLEAPLREVLAAGQLLSQVPLRTAGSVPVPLRLVPLRTARGTVVGVELLVEANHAADASGRRDTTPPAIREAAAALQASEPPARATSEHAPVGIASEAELRFQAQLLDAVGQGVIATDFDGTVRYWNRFAEQLYGWTREEALGRSILELVATDLSLEQGHEIMALLRSGQRWAGQYAVRRRDGTSFPAFVTDMPLYGADGSVVGMVGVSSDITEQQRLAAEREELLARERRARAAVERVAARIAELQALTAALSEALTPAQVAEVIVSRSMAALGATSGALRVVSADGRSLDALHSSGIPAAVVAQWSRIPLDAPLPVCEVARTGRPLSFDDRDALLRAYPDLGATVSLIGHQAFAVVPLSIEGRTVGSLALTFAEPRSFGDDDHDVLRAMASQAAQAIERARLYDAAREAVEVRDTFITVASHELRTPITALLGQAQLLERRARRAGLDDALMRPAQAIAEQVQRLSRMVTALLDLSRIQSGQLTVDIAPLDLAALATRVAAGLQPTLAHHTLVLSGESAGLWVAGDEVRLEQVLSNLIVNAVKYSPQGGTLRIQVAQREAQACIAVSDDGIGIPAESLPRLFERFYRASNAQASGISGLGIGLYTVREILALHRGTIAVDSHEGVGSTFTVSLPLAPAAPD